MVKNIGNSHGEKLREAHRTKKTVFLMLILIAISIILHLSLASAATMDYTGFHFDTSAVSTAPQGITSNGTDVWIVDTTENEIYWFNSNGTYVTKLDISGELGGGFYGAGSNSTDVYAMDYNGFLHAYPMDLGAGVIESIDISGTTNAPMGGDSDDTVIWVCSLTNDRAYELDMAGNYISNFTIAPTSPTNYGCTMAGGDIIVSDINNDYNISRYTTAGVNTHNYTASAGSNPTGIGHGYNGSGWFFYSVDPTDREVYVYEGIGAPIPTAGIFASLLIPPNNTALSSTENIFTANFSIASSTYNFTNATIFIWNSTNEFNATTNIITGESYNDTLWNISGFSVGTYNWDVEACGINDTTSTFCNQTNSGNFTFTVISFEVTNESYVNTTIEGNTEQFGINVTMTSAVQISTAYLIYNNTAYLGTKTNLGGGDYRLHRNLIIPGFNLEVNNTFYWSFTLENGFEYNHTEHNQTVQIITLDDCAANTIVLLNYSLKDEESQDLLNESIFNTSVEVDVNIYPKGSSNLVVNYTQNYTDVVNPQVCINAYLLNTTYEMWVQTRYTGDSYSAEFHNIQNFTLTNASIPQEIDLFDLLDADAQRFLITYKDEDFLPVDNALIDIQRKYIAEGVFKSVELPVTDRYGETVGHFDLDGILYTVIVSKNGNILATFDNIAVICQDVVIEDCRLELNAVSTGRSFDEWDETGGISYTIDFDRPTKTVTVIFSTTDGSTSTVFLNTTKFDRWGNQTVCTDTLTSSSGTLTCVVPDSFGNLTIVSDLYNNGVLVTQRIYSLEADAGEYFGEDTIFMVIILMITLPLMMITSPIGVIIGVMLGMIMAGSLLMVKGDIIGTTSAVVWIILAGGILIWKIARRES